MRHVKARFQAAGDPVWDDDCVELSVASDWRQKAYLHFMANSLGAHNMLARNGATVPASVAGKWQVSSKRGANGWQVMMRVPLSGVDSELWKREKLLYMHLNREAHKSGDYSGWPSGNFHAPAEFGRVIFGSYADYLHKQLQICRALAAKVKAAAEDIAVLPPEKIDFAANSYADNLAHDWNMRNVRRKLEFSDELMRCAAMLKQGDMASAAQLLTSLDKSATDGVMRGRYNILRSEYLKRASGDAPFAVWVKSPYIYLDPQNFPPQTENGTVRQELHCGVGEYESASFAVTNFTGRELAVSIKTSDKKLKHVIRYALPRRGSCGMINDALPLLINPLKVPPHSSMEVQIVFNTAGLPPGAYLFPLEFSTPRVPSRRGSVALRIYPVRLRIPEKTFNVFFSPYSMQRRSGNDYAQAFLSDMEAHYCRTIQPGGGSIPAPVFDADGRNMTDYSKFLAELPPHRPGYSYTHYWGFYLQNIPEMAKDLAGKFGAPFMSAEFKRRFGVWLGDWWRVVVKSGIADDFYMYMFDETTHPDAEALLRLAKETNPQVKIFMTVSTTSTMEHIKRIIPYVDAISPHFYTWCNKAELWDMLREKNIKVSPYFNVAPGSAFDEPFAVYRKMSQLADSVGADGCGTWVYFYSTFAKWNPISMSMVNIKNPVFADSLTGAPATLAPGELLIPTKRWEAYRDSMEHSFYLRMLQGLAADKRISADRRQKCAAFAAGVVASSCTAKTPEELEAIKKQMLELLAACTNDSAGK